MSAITHPRYKKETPRALETYRPGARVTPQEIQHVLAHEGYSANQRRAWLKELLTDVTNENSKTPSEEKKRLIEEIKAAIDLHQQQGRPLSDDVL